MDYDLGDVNIGWPGSMSGERKPNWSEVSNLVWCQFFYWAIEVNKEKEVEMTYNRLAVLVLTTILMLRAPVYGILITNSGSIGYGVNGNGVQTGPYQLTSFNVAGSNKLIVGVTNEAGGVPSSVTYEGQPLLLAESSNEHPSSQMGVFYGPSHKKCNIRGGCDCR